MLHSNGIEPKIIFETNNQETQKKMVLADFGYTVVPKHMIEHEVKEDKLKIIRLSKKMSANIFLARHRSRSLTKQGELFFGFLKKMV